MGGGCVCVCVQMWSVYVRYLKFHRLSKSAKIKQLKNKRLYNMGTLHSPTRIAIN